MTSDLKRKCRPEFNGIDNSSSDDGENIDPFKCSDSEKDPDFAPSPKKACHARSKGERNVMPINVSIHNFDGAKTLSARDRLKRLKQKFVRKKPSAENTAARSSNQIEIASQNNEKIGIENQSGAVNGLESQTSESTVNSGPYFGSYDHIFKDEDDNESSSNGTSNNQNRDNRLGLQMAEPTVKSGPSFANNDILFDNEDASWGCGVQNDNAILNLVLELRDGMSAMLDNFKMLSKQMARIEMKTLRGPPLNNCEYDMNIAPELLLNLDDSLAKEGIPITTCVELNEFEAKLRQDRKYREKLVRFFICIDYFILFASLLT